MSKSMHNSTLYNYMNDFDYYHNNVRNWGVKTGEQFTLSKYEQMFGVNKT